MKLYATVSSERATKGQGGNEYVNITLLRKVGDKNVPMYFVGLYENEMVVEHIPTNKEVYRETKGKLRRGGEAENKLAFALFASKRVQNMPDVKVKRQKGECDCYMGSIGKPHDIDCNSRK